MANLMMPQILQFFLPECRIMRTPYAPPHKGVPFMTHNFFMLFRGDDVESSV